MAVHAGVLERGDKGGLWSRLNTRWHEPALWVFLVVALGHWAEHLVQAVQIWLLDMPRPEALGALGYAFPTLVTEEYLHYGYALVMLALLGALMPGFSGQARWLWGLALGIQIWHHFEHLVLFAQSATNTPYFGKDVPTSFLQLLYPRAELHLVYNALVFAPMLAAMLLHRYPPKAERQLISQGDLDAPACSCARD